GNGDVGLWKMSQGGPEQADRLDGKGGAAVALAFAPDGRSLAGAHESGGVAVWDLHGPKGPPIPGHAARVNAVAFAPDGRGLLSGSADTTVRLWEVVGSAMKERAVFRHDHTVHAVAFAPDGKSLAS